MKTTDMKETTVITLAVMSALFFASTGHSARIAVHPSSDIWLTVAADPELPSSPPITPLEPAPAVPPPAAPQAKKPAPSSSTPPASAKESTRPAVKPAPGEARTPEEASARAADRNDPSGALIFVPPQEKGRPAKTP